MELSAKIINGFKLLAIIAKSFIDLQSYLKKSPTQSFWFVKNQTCHLKEANHLVFTANQMTKMCIVIVYQPGCDVITFEINDTHREKLSFSPFSTRMAAWLSLIFFACLHIQLSSIHSYYEQIGKRRFVKYDEWVSLWVSLNLTF